MSDSRRINELHPEKFQLLEAEENSQIFSGYSKVFNSGFIFKNWQFTKNC